jgi:hypothetical protein
LLGAADRRSSGAGGSIIESSMRACCVSALIPAIFSDRLWRSATQRRPSVSLWPLQHDSPFGTPTWPSAALRDWAARTRLRT